MKVYTKHFFILIDFDITFIKSMSSKISHSIKHRATPKDVFITPKPLAKKAIDMIMEDIDEEPYIWYDPFKNSGSFYNQYPKYKGIEHKWSEILEGKDFFEFNENIDIICSNPPYSCLDKVFKKCIELKPHIISLLLGVGNLTARRIEMMEKAGYGITKLHMCKVYKWYGMSYIVQFEKGGNSIMTYDRVVWREEERFKKQKKI